MYLSPMSDEEEPDGRQEGEHEVGPVLLQGGAVGLGGAVHRRGGEEVAEQDQVNDARDDLDQDLWSDEEGSLCQQGVSTKFTHTVFQCLSV